MNKILLKLRKEGQTYHASIEYKSEVQKQELLEYVKYLGYKIIRVTGD